MPDRGMTALVFVALSATTLAGDLSRYRQFQFGADLATVAKQSGVDPAEASTISRRPAVIQELQWRPQALGWSAKAEAAQHVTFSFYNGELFRIVVDYDVQETQGLTPDDVIDAVSAIYGTASRPSSVASSSPEFDGDGEVGIARWQDPQYRYDLVRSSYGEGFRLIGVMRRLAAPAQSATLEAKRLDDLEAPQRDAAKAASDEAADKARMEKERLVNKPAFRP